MFKSGLNLFYLLLAFGLLLTACSSNVIAGDQLPTAVPEPTVQSDATADLMDALVAAGALVEKRGEVTQPFFSETGQVISVNGSEVQLFVYDDEAAARAEAGQVTPEGTAVGSNVMMWLATPHFYRSDKVIALYIGDDPATLTALEAVLGPQFAGGQSAASSDEIGKAALVGLQQIGWDINGFSAETTAVDGDHARVTITSTDPPGGFTAFMVRQAGEWIVAAHGSAFNPEELKTMGFPDSVLP